MDLYRVISRGLNVRETPDVPADADENIITKLVQGNVVEKLDVSLDQHWYKVRFEQNGQQIVGWVAMRFVVPLNAPTVASVERMIVGQRGVHASAGGWKPTDAELGLVRHNQVETVFIVTYERNQSEAIRLFRDAGVQHFLFRAAHHGELTADAENFVEKTLPNLKDYQAALGNGTPFYVAIHNEPNLSIEGLGGAWPTAADFSIWFLAVAKRYRDELPGVKIGFPAMSPGPDWSGTTAAGLEVRRQDEWTFTNACRPAIRASDWVGVHAYFAGDGLDIQLKPTQWRRMAQGKPIIITEGGPGDSTDNSGEKLRNLYQKCAEHSIPVMAWVLSGAGGWKNADWVEKTVKI